MLIAAWGNPNGIDPARYQRHIAEVMALLAGQRLFRVGPLTLAAQPRHGLFWPSRAELSPCVTSACETQFA